MVLEIIISKFSCTLKMMSRNTFLEYQPDSASYTHKGYDQSSSNFVRYDWVVLAFRWPIRGVKKKITKKKILLVF